MIFFKTLIFLFVLLFLAEIVFRVCYRLICHSKYVLGKKIKWEDNYIVPHPFLSFSYKKNSQIKLRKKLRYDLCKNKYYSFETPLKINNFGHFGDDFEEEKDSGTLRIACVGNSTTANNISFENKDYSYPNMLQETLQDRIINIARYDKVEVYNFGIGGWVCQDILIDFLLNVVRTKPDYIIFCHGFVDVPYHLMNGFSNDYCHGRKNLGEVINNIKIISSLPRIKYLKLYDFLVTKIFGTGNVRDDVVLKIRKQKVDINNDFDTLKYEMDIIRYIFVVCKYFNIEIILSTYPFYNYMNTSLSNKIECGVLIENENIKKLSKEFDSMFVDHDSLIPKSDEYFLDYVHFTPKGMRVLSLNYSELIMKDLIKKENA